MNTFTALEGLSKQNLTTANHLSETTSEFKSLNNVIETKGIEKLLDANIADQTNDYINRNNEKLGLSSKLDQTKGDNSEILP